MTIELHTDDRPAPALPGAEAVPDGGAPGSSRPNVSGDLPTIFEMAPMFRRVLVGYDRFQVDTYVQWAEHQLATAEHEREHLETRHLQTRAELDEARELLSHSSGGAEFLSLSRRVGSLLAAAADEAEGMRAEADAHRSAAAAEADRTVRLAERVLADARTEADRLVAAATAESAEVAAHAARILEAARETGAAARAEAAARLEEARLTERRALRRAEEIRQEAEDAAVAARLRTRQEAVQLLAAGREQRRAADARAEAAREGLDRQAWALRSEIGALERRRAALRAEVALLADRVVPPVADPSTDPVRRLLERGRSLRVR